MNLAQWPIFKAGIFKQAKYLVSTPEKAQPVLAIQETGIVGIQKLPMETGFMQLDEAKKAWAAVHALKFQIYKNGQPTDQEAVLVLSERNYIPLDPLDNFGQEDREKLASLPDIAKVRHAQARSVAGAQDPHKNISQIIIEWGLVYLGLCTIIAFIQGC